MDFIVSLFRTKKDNNVIFVVVNCLSIQTYFVPTKTMAMAKETNKLLYIYIYIYIDLMDYFKKLYLIRFQSSLVHFG
jgi:hypothetical protein